jgi:flagellar hook protein FlgE
MLNQTMNYGSVANGSLEGTDPTQVGMGVGGSVIHLLNTQGTVESTGRLTDMAIQGNGYFVVNNGQQNYFTRDGSFTVAPDGTLESSATGMKVMGWGTNATTGAIDTTTPLSAIQIPTSAGVASATANLSLAGNLDSTQATYSAGPPATGGTFTSPITVYDSLGTAHQLNVTLQKTGNQAWSYTITAPTDSNGNTDPTLTGGDTGTINFTANGQYDTANNNISDLQMTFADGANNGDIKLDLSKITQLAASSQVNVSNVDGTPGGTISTFNVDKNGVVSAIFSNGDSKALGQLAMSNFRNPDGLQRDGDNLYSQGVNSGTPLYGQAGTGTLGTVSTGQLEGSNVDLAAQFAQMIQAQQGFNANAKVITTSNQMLQSVMGIVP